MNKLRIGVILPDSMVPTWVGFMLETVRDSADAEINALAFADFSPHNPPPNKQYELQLNLDKRVFRPSTDPWDLCDVRRILHNTQVLGENLHERLSRLKSMRIDLLLNLSLETLPKSLLGVARFGAWSLRCNDIRVTAGSEIGWLEILHDNPVMHCDVEIQREENTVAWPGSVMATHRSSISLNQSAYYWRAARVIPRALQRLRSMGEQEFFSRAKSVEPAKKAELPSASEIRTLIQKQALEITENKIRRRITPQPWALMAGRVNSSFDWNTLTLKSPPREVFWADPFLVKKQDKSYLFFEEYVYKTDLGRIVCASVDEAGAIGTPQIVLERPYHLSYPFVFEHRGELYMIPETAQNRSVELYRCTRFPDQWEFHKTLISGVNAVDATLIEHGIHWWMFVNIAHEGGSTWDELHLYYSSDPLSTDWTAHPLNPVISDVRSARPAGRIFRRDGGLIRPSQDSSQRYGYAVNLNRIIRLTPHEYEEELLERIEPPNKNILGVHTYDRSGDLVVVDALLKK